MMQQESPLRNSSASTSDWIGQVKGRVIYAYDLSTLISEAGGKLELTKEGFEQASWRVSPRGLASGPDEASSKT